MNKTVLSTLFAGAIAALTTAPAFSVDTGTVNFKGKIVADTCQIDVDGSGASSNTVTFEDTYPGDYTGDGSIGTSKDFTIALTGCDTLIPKLNLRFSGTTTDSGTDKRLKNDLTGAGMATNVGITLSNKNGGSGDVVFNTDPEAASDVDHAGTGATVMRYTANVIQVGADIPTTGQYSANASFEILYR
nr:fimbrial protein [uncultured Enterobacter sp.]